MSAPPVSLRERRVAAARERYRKAMVAVTLSAELAASGLHCWHDALVAAIRAGEELLRIERDP